MRKKINPELVETIRLSKKNQEIASLLAVPTRKQLALNLDEINKQVKDKETIIVPGKILGQGNINKKVKIIAFSFSKTAEEKLKKAKIQISSIKKELEKNKKLQGRVLK